MITLSDIQKNEKVADLGSGDGRISIAFAKKEARVDAYELDDQLINLSRKNAASENTLDHITIYKENFWNISLSPYDIITIYPMPDIMLELEKKLAQEMQKGARVLLNFYPLPLWKHTALKDNIYLYIK